MKRVTWNSKPLAPLTIEGGFGTWGERYFQALLIDGYSRNTVVTKRENLRQLANWCADRSIERPQQVSEQVLAGFQRYLHYHRKLDGTQLSVTTQRTRLTAVKMFFTWLYEQGAILTNPAGKMKMPKQPQQLPRNVLSLDEAESIMAQPDLNRPTGLRDRAMLETLYSCGIRRKELLGLALMDLDADRRILVVRSGKGGKDRFVPIGSRALHWIERYLEHGRDQLVKDPGQQALFLSTNGGPLTAVTINKKFRQYFVAAGVNKDGSCHIFRHSTATAMLDHGADIRHIQQLLGHASLTTTQIYTHVSLKQLQEVHERTHPAKLHNSQHQTDK